MSKIKPLTLTVSHARGTYPILIGEQLLAMPTYWRSAIVGEQVLIITNDTVSPLYLGRLQSSLSVCDSSPIDSVSLGKNEKPSRSFMVETLILPDGEQYKTLDTFSRCMDVLAAKPFHRDATILALGGGVIGDLAGFAASCYQRGIAFIQFPTTLLSQVDASIGGKTAVNHPCGKNLIGAFHQPEAVVIDTTVLQTLPRRELVAGSAEIIKAALIRDHAFFDWLCDHIDDVLALKPEALTHAISQACDIKRAVVAADERERGVRALLNLGHTFAHAIENNLGYGTWLHGEAVGLGLMMAADLSHHVSGLSADSVKRIKALVQRAGLPQCLPSSLKYDKFLQTMRGDKKVQQQQLRFVILSAIGQADITSAVEPQLLAELFQAYITSN